MRRTGQAEVEEPRALGGHEHVRGLQIPVPQARALEVLQRPPQIAGQHPDELAPCGMSLRARLGQRRPRNEAGGYAKPRGVRGAFQDPAHADDLRRQAAVQQRQEAGFCPHELLAEALVPGDFDDDLAGPAREAVDPSCRTFAQRARVGPVERRLSDARQTSEDRQHRWRFHRFVPEERVTQAGLLANYVVVTRRIAPG